MRLKREQPIAEHIVSVCVPACVRPYTDLFTCTIEHLQRLVTKIRESWHLLGCVATSYCFNPAGLTGKRYAYLS